MQVLLLEDILGSINTPQLRLLFSSTSLVSFLANASVAKLNIDSELMANCPPHLRTMGEMCRWLWEEIFGCWLSFPSGCLAISGVLLPLSHFSALPRFSLCVVWFVSSITTKLPIHKQWDVHCATLWEVPLQNRSWNITCLCIYVWITKYARLNILYRALFFLWKVKKVWIVPNSVSQIFNIFKHKGT